LIAAGLAIVLSMTTSLAAAQDPAKSTNTISSVFSIPEGYTAHHSIDVNGRMADVVGSGAMYDTMVNLQSGPRVSSESLDLHKLDSNKKALVDNARISGSGFGGDPYNFVKLTAERGKFWEFSGSFRRNRQYFDYDLLGNPNIPKGLSVAIGPSSAPTGSFAWPQVQHSSSMINSVRRMTDTQLTLFPVSKITIRIGYSQNVMQGASLLPARSAGIMKYAPLLQQMQRHSNDQYTAAIDWKPFARTVVTYEQIVLKNKENSSFNLDPNGFLAQEADGTPVYLGNWNFTSNGSATATTTLTPYSSAACNSPAVAGQAFSGLSASGVPIIDPTCAVITNYSRTNPTRTTMPTETLRLQSTSIKNLAINGQASYSNISLNMPSYLESMSGLTTGTTASPTARTEYWAASGTGKRQVFNADFGLTWQVAPSFTLSDQVSLMSSREPGSITYPSYTRLMFAAGTALANQSVNNGTLITTTCSPSTPGGLCPALATTGVVGSMSGVLAGTYLGTTNGFFGVNQITNTATAGWTASPKLSLALSYRYGNRNIGHNTGFLPAYAVNTTNTPVRDVKAITEQAGIFNAAYRVNANWDINGTWEVAYNDESYTTSTPRQTRRYRVHSKFRPEKWATMTVAFSDAEKRNNTNDTAADILAGTTVSYGLLQHEERTRSAGFSGMLTPNEHFAIDFDYAYVDTYTATNTCYTGHDTSMLIGTSNTATSVSPLFAAAVSLNASGAPQVCKAPTATSPSNFYARMYADAPTQYGSVGVLVSPNDKVQAGIGYRVNRVAGEQFFIDARDVNGAMASKYQTPYLNASWKATPALTWKAEFNYYGYGEGGPSGAKNCTLDAVGNPNLASAIVPCATISVPTGMNSGTAGMTAPRVFHANNISLGFHYEF
jgi:hypothetical protein